MPSPVSFTKATLGSPLYSVDFDPYNRGYLIVGGGGGEGRHGIKNRITLLDITSRSSLDVAAEAELSSNEDSVSSIGALASKDGLIALAGINSSEADQKSGTNEHLRTFDIRYPKKSRTNAGEKPQDSDVGSISSIGKSSLFKPAKGPKPETYQRLLRLSPARRSENGSKRIGVIATGLAKEPELIVFDTTRSPPSSSEVITRIDLPSEAADIDIAETGSSEFSVTYVTDYEVYEQTITYDFVTKKSELTPRGPRKIHSAAIVDGDGKSVSRSRYKAVRFLTNHHILVMSNLPDKKGAELHIMHLYPTGPAAVLFHKVLPSRIKQSVTMDVCRLDTDSEGNRQFVIAIAGQDASIEVYTINYVRFTDTFSPFRNFSSLRDVHSVSMSALAFSQFHSPTRAPDTPPAGNEQETKTPLTPAHPTPQYIRLASVSIGNTVVVDTFALSPLQPTKKDSRYVLSHPSEEKWTQKMYIALISVMVLVTAIILQSYFAPATTQSALSFLPPGARQWIDKPAEVADEVGHTVENAVDSVQQAIPEGLGLGMGLQDLLDFHKSNIPGGSSDSTAIVLRQPPADSTDIGIEVIPDREEFLRRDAQARHWHQLEEHEKRSWKENLIKAGQWSADEGETILKGILFSSYAGFVGQAVHWA